LSQVALQLEKKTIIFLNPTNVRELIVETFVNFCGDFDAAKWANDTRSHVYRKASILNKLLGSLEENLSMLLLCLERRSKDRKNIKAFLMENQTDASCQQTVMRAKSLTSLREDNKLLEIMAPLSALTCEDELDIELKTFQEKMSKVKVGHQ
jgi:hypothetical protein